MHQSASLTPKQMWVRGRTGGSGRGGDLKPRHGAGGAARRDARYRRFSGRHYNSSFPTSMTPPLTGRPRVLLADDYEPLLTAWRRLLEPSCEVVGAVRDGRALLAAAVSLTPDVIIADLAMPEMNGLDACREIRNALPDAKIVVVTAGGDEWVARAAFRAGAAAFVLKHSAADDLLMAVHNALHGVAYCTPAVGIEAPQLH